MSSSGDSRKHPSQQQLSMQLLGHDPYAENHSPQKAQVDVTRVRAEMQLIIQKNHRENKYVS
jgi:hypothetical protein